MKHIQKFSFSNAIKSDTIKRGKLITNRGCAPKNKNNYYRKLLISKYKHRSTNTCQPIFAKIRCTICIVTWIQPVQWQVNIWKNNDNVPGLIAKSSSQHWTEFYLKEFGMFKLSPTSRLSVSRRTGWWA